MAYMKRPKKIDSKQNLTREKILKGAIEVFSNYPYYTASIRMVGKTAKVEHPLVNYYFPSKAALFEAVIKHVANEYYQENILWFEGLEKLDIEAGLGLYIDRLFDFAEKNPSALRIIALNLVQPEGHDVIPGYALVKDFFEKTKKIFKNTIPMRGKADDLEMLHGSFNTLAINYLGAGSYYASLLGIKPGSRQYLTWVKKTMMFVLLPQLKQIISGEQKR